MRKKKILIVDDESDLVEMLRDRLESLNYQVLTAYDGKAGLEKARKEMPDLMLLDVMMPKRNGYEVCSELKMSEKTRGIVIMMLTAKIQESERFRGLKSGADEYIVKPFDMASLLAKIRKHLEDSAVHRILVATEDRDLVRNVMHHLGLEGHEVIPIYDGLRSADRIQQQRPDLILLDLKNFAEASQGILQQLQARPEAKKIPVVGLKGSEQLSLEGACQSVCQEIFQKPYNMSMLYEKIQKLLAPNAPASPKPAIPLSAPRVTTAVRS